MNEKQIEYKLNNQISLRAIYFSILAVLVGGLVSLLNNLNSLNIILLILGTFMACIFTRNIYNCNLAIAELIKIAGKY